MHTNIVVGCLLIAAGIAFCVLATYAVGVATRSREFWQDTAPAMSPGVMFILFGLFVLLS